MRIYKKKTPRNFSPVKNINLNDCGKISLRNNEQISLIYSSGINNDIVKKEWGFYLTNSCNNNLRIKGFKIAFVLNQTFDRTFINLVHKTKINEFNKYLKIQNSIVLLWLDEYKIKKNKNFTKPA